MTATQRVPTMKPMFAMSSWPGASSASILPTWTNTLGATSSTSSGVGFSARAIAAQVKKTISAAHVRRCVETRPVIERPSESAAVRSGTVPRRREMRLLRIDCIDRDGRGERPIARDANGRIFTDRDAGVGFEQGLVAGTQKNVRHIVRRNRVAAQRIDLKSRMVRMANADLQRLRIRRRTEADFAELAA